MTNTSHPSVTKPNGPTAADLLHWWYQRAEASPTATEQGYLSVCRDVLAAVVPSGEHDDYDIRTLDVEEALADMAAGAWKPLSATTRRNYTARFRRAVADFHAALLDPTVVRTIRHRSPRTSTAPVGTGPAVRVSIDLPSGGTALLRLGHVPSPGEAVFLLDALRRRLAEQASPKEVG